MIQAHSEQGTRRMGWMGWTAVTLLIVALALFGFWRWAINSQSVALLDRVDAFWTSGPTATSDPIAFGDEPGQVLTVSRPDDPGRGLRPVVIFIHGGSWAKGHAPDYAFVGRNLAAGGYIGVSAGYRLVPGGEFPAMLEDGAAATKWVVDNIADFGGDPSRIYLMGHSAGAYNAIMLALDPRWLDDAGVSPAAIRGAIGLAGPYDFLPLDSESTINAFGEAADLSATQPITFARKDAPPLLLLTGDADTTVRPRNSITLAKAMTDAGQPTEVRQFPGMSHSAIVMALSRPFEGDRAVKYALYDFLEAQEIAPFLDSADETAGQSSGDIQPGAR